MTCSELLTIPINPDVILRLHYVSASRQNFATNLMRKLFPKAKRENSNVNGVLGKSALDKDKIEYNRSVTFKMYPLEQKETKESAWGKCREAIDEANRHLYRPKYSTLLYMHKLTVLNTHFIDSTALLKEMCSITHGVLFLKCNLNRKKTAMLFTEDFWE